MRKLLLAVFLFAPTGCGDHSKTHKPAPDCIECECKACECDLEGNCECPACECVHRQPEGDGSGHPDGWDGGSGGGDHCPGGHC